jgi:cell division protein FtsQ
MFGFKTEKKNKRKSRNQARRKQSAQGLQWRWSRKYTWPAAVVLVLVAVVVALPGGEFLPIQKIRISGQFSELDTSTIEQQLRPHLGKGFFAVNIEDIQSEVLQQPWVSSVSIHRVWPNELSVRILERKAFARWDEQHLLSRDGEVFSADVARFASLPLIRGYEGQSHGVLQRYMQTRKRLVEQSIDVKEYLEDGKGALTLLLGSGLQVSLGSEQPERKLEQLLAVYDLHIRNRTQQIRHIDFRYSNGFAVAWKSEHLNQRSELLLRGEKNV